MAYKLTGRIISVGDTQEMISKSGTEYRKRDFVMTVRKFDPYTGQPADDEGNTPKFSLFGDRCNDLNGIFKGDVVIVYFEINGRSFMKDGKTEYFTEVRPLRVEKVGYGSVSQMESERQPMTVDVAEPYGQKVSVVELMEEGPKKKEAGPEDDEDLPF